MINLFLLHISTILYASFPLKYFFIVKPYFTSKVTNYISEQFMNGIINASELVYCGLLGPDIPASTSIQIFKS